MAKALRKKAYEHGNRNFELFADSEIAWAYSHDLPEGNTIRISEESALAHVHGLGPELPDHVLHSVRACAQLPRGDRWDWHSDLPDCHLRNIRRDGCIAIRNR